MRRCISPGWSRYRCHSRLAQSFKDAQAARKSQEDEAIDATEFPMAVSWYSLRHSYASRLDQLRVPIDDISKLLGHANVTTTLTSYI